MNAIMWSDGLTLYDDDYDFLHKKNRSLSIFLEESPNHHTKLDCIYLNMD